MDDPTKLPDHNPGEPPAPIENGGKPLSQPKIRRYAIIVIIMVVLGLLGVAALSYTLSRPVNNQETNDNSGAVEQPSQQTADVTWTQSGDGQWTVLGGGVAPPCPAQLFTNSPTDISKVTAVLYPGQVRGGNYKPHGGFRLDGTANDAVTVKMPFDGIIYRASQYIELGERQYLFDVMHPCGYLVRFDHLRTLGEAFNKVAAGLPEPTESSLTNQVTEKITVKAGETVATAVGFVKNNNVSFDFGVYDLRTANEASKDPAYQQAHQSDKALSWHAVCWFDLLPGVDSGRIKGLPAADATAGKTSDYCK